MTTEAKTLRRVEVLRDEQWVQVRMKELVPGDRFRMFEDDGETVSTEFGTEWYVTRIPEVTINEYDELTWGVESKPVVNPNQE